MSSFNQGKKDRSIYSVTGYKKGDPSKPSRVERLKDSEQMKQTFAEVMGIVDGAYRELAPYAKRAELYEFPKVLRNCMVSLSECYSKLDYLANSKGFHLDE